SADLYRDIGLLEVTWVLTAPGLLVFLVGVAVALRRGPRLIGYGLATVLVYYLLVARYARVPWGIQYHIYAVPYAARAVGLGLGWLMEKAGPGRLLVLGLVSVAFLARVAPLYAAMRRPPPSPRIACGAQVARLVPEEALIIVSSGDRTREAGSPN